jgi:hypothetical protein
VEKVVGDDLFLRELMEDFLDNARYLISKAYCRIRQRIELLLYLRCGMTFIPSFLGACYFDKSIFLVFL